MKRIGLLAALLAATLAACAGGSGSSGFDLTAAALENRGIEQALDAGRCVDAEAAPICPTDAPGTAPSEGPPPAPGVDTNLPPDAPLSCVQETDDGSCLVSFAFVPSGLPADASVRVAVRSVEPPGPWTVEPSERVVNHGGSLEATVPLPAGSASVQFAVLAFFDPLAETPAGAVETLGGTGTDLVFVTPPLTPFAP